jgi:hypothetical protein
MGGFLLNNQIYTLNMLLGNQVTEDCPVKNNFVAQIHSYDESIKDESKPHKCPICYGKTFVIQDQICPVSDHYKPLRLDGLARPITDCLSCNGTGIVWSKGQ